MAREITRKAALVRFVWSLVLALAVPLLLMLLGGDWGWREGWAFSGWWIGFSFTTIVYFYLTDPAALGEQFQLTGPFRGRGWERWLSVLARAYDDAWFNVQLADGSKGWMGAVVTEPVGGWGLAEIKVVVTVPPAPSASPNSAPPTSAPQPTQPI